MENSSSFFANRACAYFPCHEEADAEAFNCLFCFCPLYGREDCGGAFSYTEGGIKDCSSCTLPHEPMNYDYIMGKLSEK